MTSPTGWQSRAACRGTATPTGDPFFTTGSEDQALALCQVCPVESVCLAYHGHPFDLANTYYTPDGRRRCRACLRAARRSWGVRRRMRAKVGGCHA